LFYLIKKEFQQLKRDKRLMFILIVMPVIQIIIFGYVFSTDVKNISTAVVDKAQTTESRALVGSLKSAGYFTLQGYADGRAEIMRRMEEGSVKVGLIIPSDYSTKLARDETAQVEALIDGSDPNTGGNAASYLLRIAQAQGLKIKIKRLGGRTPAPPLDARLRILYNPDMKSSNYMIPGMVGYLMMLVTLLLTASSVVKERERGTMEHLIVMPLRRWELILGKITPFILFGFLDILLITTVGTLWFNVPLRGSLFLIFVLAAIFLFTSLGLGLFVSTTARTQQQAMMTAYFILLPTMILSGLIFPIESMPPVIQTLTYVFPLRYFLVIVRSIFLKGSGLVDLWQQAVMLMLYGSIVFILSVWRFQKKLT
jgi:ABC-2 type transport system permease protein